MSGLGLALVVMLMKWMLIMLDINVMDDNLRKVSARNKKAMSRVKSSKKMDYFWSDELELFIVDYIDFKGEPKQEEAKDLGTAFVKAVRSMTKDLKGFTSTLNR